jgi:hypothetical protein
MPKANKKILAVAGSVVVSLSVIASAVASENIKLEIDGRQMIPAEAPQNINGHVMIPVRFVSEALGAKVDWDSKEQAVSIDSQGKEFTAS